VQELVTACKTGAATNIIYGLALGYKSVIAPVLVLSTIIYVSFEICDLYGIALAAVGMLGNLATGLTIDAYGPVCDNAGGIAEMAELPKSVRTKTDALDAAGNTTAAVGKGFAIGSAALVSLALYGAFVVRIRDASNGLDVDVQILQPLVFAFLLIGSMLPFWFSAMTMKSVGEAATEMVVEVERQFKANPNLLDPTSHDRPDYNACVEISTKAALREMVAPGALVILAPLITGTFFGVHAVYGLLTGGLLSGVQLAISMSNTGGAWDNCKKHIEGTGGKGSELHKAAVVGDTVGDPLKDTSGPALNILMKLMAIISLVFADFFYSINNGQGILKMPIN
jgi:inorganic pyrophosphatase